MQHGKVMGNTRNRFRTTESVYYNTVSCTKKDTFDIRC